MTTLREAAQMALDALEHLQTDIEWQYKSPTRAMLRKVEKALRTALAQPEQEPINYEEWNYDPMTGKPLWEKQPEQEPVAWFIEGTFEDGTPSFTQVCETDPEFYVPLYTAPPQRECGCGDSSELGVVHRADAPCFHYEKREWQGLTDEDYEAMAEKYVTNCYFDTLKYARAIEAKLREKNS